jgi:F-type H+-transporting ATPase subunit b
VELNWSTFILEIINFLVLVWILKHFFYKPVLNIIARRKADIDNTLTQAKDLHTEAEALRHQYEHRLQDWEQEKQLARDELRTEINQERARLMQELQQSLEQERKKIEVSNQQRLQATINKAEETSLAHSAQFATRLLESVSGPEVEGHLLTLLIDELKQLPAGRLDMLRASWGEAPSEIHIVSAFPLSENPRQSLEQVLRDITQLNLPFQYEQDKALLAGLRISIGAWVLGINLQDELKGFVELAHGS